MMMERALKILMTGGLAVLCALIAIGNINDPDLNQRFVQHVLSMDTVEGGLRPMVSEARSSGNPLLVDRRRGGADRRFHRLGNGRALARPFIQGATFANEAKRFVYAGAGSRPDLVHRLFRVAGESFAMWQSPIGTASTPPFVSRFHSPGPIFIALSDCEIA